MKRENYAGEGREYMGIELPALSPGELAMGAIVLLKVLTPGGGVVYRETKTPDLHYIEALGMATTYVDTCNSQLRRASRGLE